MSWHNYTQGKTTTQRGYGHAWRKQRGKALERDGYICQECKTRHIITPATDVDHIIEKAHGGTDDLDNLQSLCNPCHKDKTNKRQTAPCDTNGMPTDPSHHWYTYKDA